MNGWRIVEAALAARTRDDAAKVEAAIEAAIGHRHERPIGDGWGNMGLMAGGGSSYDLKAIEPITNMQDSVLERAAVARHGSKAAVPYRSPAEAAEDLFGADDYQSVADRMSIEMYAAGEDPKTNRRVTIAYRDLGCGMSPAEIPTTIFRLGSSNKESVHWQQGAFGMGALTTYRNAEAIVLVSRKAPELLPADEEDRISIAVVRWQKGVKGRTAYYLVTSDPSAGSSRPFSVPATEYPEFVAGTYLALVSYGVEGYHRARGGDERSLDTVVNTRLFEPVLPLRYQNHFRSDRADYLRGLKRRLDDNPRDDRTEGKDVLPFTINGGTYHLPVRFWVFAKKGDAGERRKFVAYSHALAFTSNGQVHHHWTPQEFRYRTRLNKLYDKILVVVKTDQLPIEVRTDLFSPDRSELMRNDDAIRLQEQVAGFLSAWNELDDINRQLIREAIAGSKDDRATAAVARQISRALTLKGFSLGGTGKSGGGGGGGGGRVTPPIDLYDDPTTLEGPETVVAEDDKTKFVNFTVNAVDGFMPGRGQLVVTCDHPEIGPDKITVGPLHKGLVRVSVAVPLNAAEGIHKLTASIRGWAKKSGGLGSDLLWTTKLEVVDEIKRTPSGPGSKGGAKGVRSGDEVALIWTSHENQDDWDRATVGAVEMVKAVDLAAENAEYAYLAALGEAEILTIQLNNDFYGLKNYIGARAKEIAGLDAKRDQYAVGVGVGLASLHAEAEKRHKKGDTVSELWLKDARLAVGKSALAMMPGFDQLAKEAGLEDD